MGKPWRRNEPATATPPQMPAPVEIKQAEAAGTTLWLITYEYREHHRTACAIVENVAAGRRSEVIACDPATWLLAQRDTWQRLQTELDLPGKAMSDIVVLLAVSAPTAPVASPAKA